MSETIKRRERISTVLWVLVQCLLYFRHVRSAQKEHINYHKVVAERVVELQKEDLVVHKMWEARSCKEYTCYYRKLATETIQIQQEELQEH